MAWFLYRPIPSAALPTLLYLAIGTQIAALRPIPWKTGHQTVVDPLLVATGLFSPGAGVGLVAWLTTFDGRVPGRNIPWWAFFFRPAESALIHVLPSIAVAAIGHDPLSKLDVMLTGNYTNWARLGAPKAAGASDLILVMPDGGNSWYVNWAESEGDTPNRLAARVKLRS